MQKIEQTLTSMEVAKMIGREHNVLLRTIRTFIFHMEKIAECNNAQGEKIAESESVHGSKDKYFKESVYADANGQERPCYHVTKKGCELIAHKMNGIKGTEFTMLYIDRFHKMEEALEEKTIDRSQLPASMQVMYAMMDEQAKIVLKQQEQDKRMNRIEQKQDTMIETFTSSSGEEDFKEWVNKCTSRIAESPKFDKGVGTNSRYAFARNESYERLKKKWKCNLDDRVARAKGRAIERNPGISKKELDSINKLTIIAADKSLRPVYETVIKEMMIAYCVNIEK